jgi:hypothetical protein
MENKQLLDNMSRLGYPLLDPQVGFDVYATLAEVVRSDKGRYWEGFPVLLANVAKEESFEYARVEAYLVNAGEKERLKELFLLSLALYDLNKLNLKWVKSLTAHLTSGEKEKVQSYREALVNNSPLKVNGTELEPERLKNVFKNYFTLEAAETLDLGQRHEELSLEFAFSQLFSPKQKELFQKKLKGAPLSKTEREYFSRVVRKKVTALANSELHQLAQRVLEL